MAIARILLAEDEPDHSRLLELAIRNGRPDTELVLVTSGDELLQAVERQDFDCVVLDFNLADARADDLLPALGERGCHSPVVVISSAHEQDIVVRSLRSGSADFVPKTEAIHGTMLWERIEAALDRRQKKTHRRQMIRNRVRRLARLAETDPLTGLANRFGLNHLIYGRRRKPDRRGHFCVSMLDVDFFKRINDRHGHLCGDRVLRMVADSLKASIQPDGLVCRWGGEEFLVVMSETQLGAAWTWCEQMRRTLEGLRLDWADAEVPLTVSIGVAQCTSTETWDQVVARADDALRLAKQQGRNRVCCWAMVALEKLLKEEVLILRDGPQQQLERLVASAGPLLGPIQRDHLLRHGPRVANLAVRIGQRLLLKDSCLEELRRASLFHDLGKFVVPEDILAKPDQLSPEERMCCRQHADYGAEVGARTGLLSAGPMSEWVRHHHRRFDDPDESGLPLGAGVIALADAYDAMTSWRSYRRSRSPAEAAGELKLERARQFDPRVVDAALAILE